MSQYRSTITNKGQRLAMGGAAVAVVMVVCGTVAIGANRRHGDASSPPLFPIETTTSKADVTWPSMRGTGQINRGRRKERDMMESDRRAVEEVAASVISAPAPAVEEATSTVALGQGSGSGGQSINDHCSGLTRKQCIKSQLCELMGDGSCLDMPNLCFKMSKKECMKDPRCNFSDDYECVHNPNTGGAGVTVGEGGVNLGETAKSPNLLNENDPCAQITSRKTCKRDRNCKYNREMGYCHSKQAHVAKDPLVPTPVIPRLNNVTDTVDTGTTVSNEPGACIVGGEDCPAGSFCRLKPGTCLTTPDVHVGMCEIKSDICMEMYDPVCGCDGSTYYNSCFADTAGVSISRQGECIDKEPIQADAQSNDPVSCAIGSEPATAGFNMDPCPTNTFCKLDMGACLTKNEVLFGLCAPRSEFCTKLYDPVCGCDGETYANSCVANTAGVSISGLGECTIDQDMTDNKDASQGVVPTTEPQFEVSVSRPNATCVPQETCYEAGTTCTVGTETCCGVTHASMECTCRGGFDGRLQYLCMYTDRCMIPSCCRSGPPADMPPPAYGTCAIGELCDTDIADDYCCYDAFGGAGTYCSKSGGKATLSDGATTSTRATEASVQTAMNGTTTTTPATGAVVQNAMHDTIATTPPTEALVQNDLDGTTATTPPTESTIGESPPVTTLTNLPPPAKQSDRESVFQMYEGPCSDDSHCDGGLICHPASGQCTCSISTNAGCPSGQFCGKHSRLHCNADKGCLPTCACQLYSDDTDGSNGCPVGEVCRVACAMADVGLQCFKSNEIRDCEDVYGSGSVCRDTNRDGVIDWHDGASGCVSSDEVFTVVDIATAASKLEYWWPVDNDGVKTCVYSSDYPDEYVNDDLNMLLDSRRECCAFHHACETASTSSVAASEDEYWYPQPVEGSGPRCIYGSYYPKMYAIDAHTKSLFLFESYLDCCADYPAACVESSEKTTTSSTVGGSETTSFTTVTELPISTAVASAYSTDCEWHIGTDYGPRTCANSGKYPSDWDYIPTINRSMYFFATAEECCENRFPGVECVKVEACNLDFLSLEPDSELTNIPWDFGDPPQWKIDDTVSISSENRDVLSWNVHWLTGNQNTDMVSFDPHSITNIPAYGIHGASDLTLKIHVPNTATLRCVAMLHIQMPFEYFAIFVNGVRRHRVEVRKEGWMEIKMLLLSGDQTIVFRIQNGGHHVPFQRLDNDGSGRVWLDQCQIISQ